MSLEQACYNIHEREGRYCFFRCQERCQDNAQLLVASRENIILPWELKLCSCVNCSRVIRALRFEELCRWTSPDLQLGIQRTPAEKEASDQLKDLQHGINQVRSRRLAEHSLSWHQTSCRYMTLNQTNWETWLRLESHSTSVCSWRVIVWTWMVLDIWSSYPLRSSLVTGAFF
jgi:hypothetical protein